MVATGIVAVSRNRVTDMRRVVVIAVAGPSLAGCSSFSTGLLQADAAHRPGPARIRFRRAPTPRPRLGPGCKTPCSVAVPAVDSGFTVTYTLNKFLPVTVPVQVINIPGDFSTPASTTIDPNPVVAELKPAGPPPKPVRRPPPQAETAEAGRRARGIAVPAPPPAR